MSGYSFVSGEPFPEGGPRRPDVAGHSVTEIPHEYGESHYNSIELSEDGQIVYAGAEKGDSSGPSIIRAFDASDPTNLSQIGEISFEPFDISDGWVFSITADGSRLYVNFAGGLAIIDASDPSSMVLEHALQPGVSGMVQLVSGYLYITDYGGQEVWYADASNPTTLSKSDFTDSGGIFGVNYNAIFGIAADPGGGPYLYITHHRVTPSTVAIIGPGGRPLPAGFSPTTPQIASDALWGVASRPAAGAYAMLGEAYELVYVATN